ncbi:MAG: leucine-rich repeat domain-containing protein [Holosporales bacterium]|jgi:hypothetical protein|nr:leucine-rich repeat domain-containing protein [Holosporales bacterium]
MRKILNIVLLLASVPFANTAEIEFATPSETEIKGIKIRTVSDGPFTLTIPKTVKEILPNSFMKVYLPEVKFEEGSQLQVIDTGSFLSAKIGTITIPKTVKTIDNRAFHGSTIDKVIFEGDSIDINEYSFYLANLGSITAPESIEQKLREALQQSKKPGIEIDVPGHAAPEHAAAPDEVAPAGPEHVAAPGPVEGRTNTIFKIAVYALIIGCSIYWLKRLKENIYVNSRAF